MQKKDELINPNSCLNKAGDGEYIFVLLSRDKVAPEAIRFWVRRRVELGMNDIQDRQIIEALRTAIRMNLQHQGSSLVPGKDE